MGMQETATEHRRCEALACDYGGCGELRGCSVSALSWWNSLVFGGALRSILSEATQLSALRFNTCKGVVICSLHKDFVDINHASITPSVIARSDPMKVKLF